MIFIKENISIVDTTKCELIEDLGLLFSSIARNEGREKLEEYIKVAKSTVDNDYINDLKQKIIKNFDKDIAIKLCKLL